MPRPLKFSQRKGITPILSVVQKEGVSDALRNSLWSVLKLLVFSRSDFGLQHIMGSYSAMGYGIENYSTALWLDYFKQPIDRRPADPDVIIEHIRDYFYRANWYEVYDFVEFTLNTVGDEMVIDAINTMFERELAPYRFVSGVLTDITGDEEIAMLANALADRDFPGVRSHLQRALELLSDRDNPDYRNSIKESISAVESLARSIADKPQATLGDALKAIEGTGRLHPALKEGFSKLYGYTSDQGGIRHAMLSEPNITAAEAKFFLLSCTSFVNYLKAKLPSSSHGARRGKV
jgi:hypothetical protein